MCIYYLKKSYPSLVDRMKSLSPQKIKIPAMVKAEILTGVEKIARKDVRNLWEAFFGAFEIVSFDDAASYHYAALRSHLEKRSAIIGPNDLIIAATVLAHGGILVTHNTREFKRISNLLLEDWTRG
jgi:tRNA(fMet)-specific endonuclease VapC